AAGAGGRARAGGTARPPRAPARSRDQRRAAVRARRRNRPPAASDDGGGTGAKALSGARARPSAAERRGRSSDSARRVGRARGGGDRVSPPGDFAHRTRVAGRGAPANRTAPSD